MKNILGLVLIAIIGLACSKAHEKKEWGDIYKQYGIDPDSAGFEIYEQSKERIFYFNKYWGNRRACPASTFKIFNSLVALETSVAPDEELVIPWDKVERWNKDWSKDMDMREAFKVSNVPYYQELARRIGKPEMQKWLDSVRYGNMKIGDSIDQFWLNGTLQITPDEQVGFMKKLYFDQLPFSKRSQRIVRSMMLHEEKTGKYKLYYKTGTKPNNDNSKFGVWQVGFVEDSTNHPYFFSNYFETKDSTKMDKKIRFAITKAMFKNIGLPLE